MSKFDMAKAGEVIAKLEALTAHEPVHLQRDGEDVAIILAPEKYLALLQAVAGPRGRPELVELARASFRKHGKIYEALAEMEKKFDPPTS